MSEFTKTNTEQAGKRVFKLITGEIIFGEVTVINEDSGIQFLVKEPFESKKLENGTNGIVPYLSQELGNGPGGVQFHIMNVIWSLPLDEFHSVEQAYNNATSEIIEPETPSIILP